MSAVQPSGWTETIHEEAGNSGVAEGSAQQVTTAGLRRMIADPKAANKDGKTRIQLPTVGRGPE